MKMRIISGIYRGRLINIPKSDLIRPTTDRVRETLFNLLSNIIEFEDIKVLDIYAGSGSLGLECLSRGANEIHFIEKNYPIYRNLIKNIESLAVKEQCSVFKMTANAFTKKVPKAKYDLIIADPPFFKDDIYSVVENILTNGLLKQDAFIIIERSVQTKEKDVQYFNIEPFKIIGDTCLYKILENRL
jgi:16S rRNA (guanine966-N2)-methyltransferase